MAIICSHNGYAQVSRLVCMSSVDKTSGGEGERGSTAGTREQPTVTAIDGASGRTVFTESGNTDAWIATDYVSGVPR